MLRTLSVGLSLLLAGCAGGPPIVSGYTSMYGPKGGPREGAHPAIDFGGTLGEPVLAAAPGRVYLVTPRESDCGHGTWIFHEGHRRYTLYCQMMAPPRVAPGDEVRRGQVIGEMGYTGEPERLWIPRGLEPIPHLHFSFTDTPRGRTDGDLQGTYDPLKSIVGCFDPAKSYPTDRLVLTYPVACKDP